jgi:hypothetical protein
MKQCNSSHKNAQDDNYICNPVTGNWVKKDGAIGKKILQGVTKKAISVKKCSPTHINAKNPAYICNPGTGNWVKKDGAVGKQILNKGKSKSIVKHGQCDPKHKNAKNSDYICNPGTGNWVKKDGVVGKKLLQTHPPTKVKSKSPPPKVKSKSPPPKVKSASPHVGSRQECSITTTGNDITVYYYEHKYKPHKGFKTFFGFKNDIVGIFTNVEDAKQVCKCINQNFNIPGWKLKEPYKVLKYRLNDVIYNLQTYDTITQIQGHSKEFLYIVYGQLASKTPITSLTVRELWCIGATTVVNIGKTKSKAYKFQYKLNTIFPTDNLNEKQIKPTSLYHNQMYKTDGKIPILDTLGIKYELWDNADNTKGTCVWHTISKALNMPIPEIAEKIKHMSKKVSPNMIVSKMGKTTNSLVYKKLLNYENEQFGIFPKYLCEIPKFAKDYAIITFYVNKITVGKTFKYTPRDPIVQCVFPTDNHPTKVIFTVSFKNSDGSGHHVLVKLKEHAGYSYTINNVKNIIDTLGDFCKKKFHKKNQEPQLKKNIQPLSPPQPKAKTLSKYSKLYVLYKPDSKLFNLLQQYSTSIKHDETKYELFNVNTSDIDDLVGKIKKLLKSNFKIVQGNLTNPLQTWIY